MSNLRTLCAVCVLCVASVACSEQPPTSIPAADAAVPADLVFTFPDVTDRTLVHHVVQDGAAPGGPAAVMTEEDPTSYEDPPEPPVPSKLISYGTRVGHQDGYAYSNGYQLYTGNHAEMSTTATVIYEGTVIGTSTQFTESTVPFLTDWGQEKNIVVETYVFTDQTCGLRVDGRSEHRASWQWFLATWVGNWGQDAQSSMAFPPYDQAPCEQMVEPSGSGGGIEGGGTEADGVVTCWYLVTIDYQTGEILDSRFLYCESLDWGG